MTAARKRRGMRGIALITALFVVALASIAATALMTSTSIALRRTANLQDSEAAWWYAEGLQSWIAGLLKRRPGQPDVDGLGDPWAQPVTYLPFGRGGVSGQLVDLQGRFNLNNLAATGTADTYYQQQFRRLLANLPGVDLTGIPDLGAAVQQWISTSPVDNNSRVPIVDATYYLSLAIPYRPSKQLMSSPSELLAVEGVTPQIYQALEPYITALPTTGTPININTAPLPVLLSLAADVNTAKLQDFVNSRVKTPLPKVEDAYSGKDELLPADVKSSYISVDTQYFQLQAKILVGSDHMMLYSDIYRQQGNASVVYARSTGAQ